MAQAAEGSEGSSVANSSSNYWDLQTNFVSSWTNTIPTWHPPPNNPNSNSSCDEEISNSFTNTSNHSGLSDVSSCHRKLVVSAGGRQPSREPTENLLWNQVLRNVGSNGDLNHGRYVEENFLEALTLSSKNLPTNMYEPACDYLKKMDNGWEFPISPSFNNLDKQLNSFSGSLLEHQRLGNLSNLVSNWSIALPLPESNCQVSTTTPSTTCDRDISMDSFHQQYSSSCGILEGIRSDNSGMFPCYEHELLKNQQEEIESLNHASFQSFKANSIRNQMSNNCLGTGENNKSYFCSIPEVPLLKNNSKNLSDVISFNGFLNKPVMDIQQPSKQSLKPTNSSETKKHGHENSLSARGRGKGSGITSGEGKKKRSEENSETVFKKPKQETSTVPSVKGQATKVKLGDRITALQQIVSPFGKTDTASVLQEAIGYIKFLQEQVQLLSNPYVKVNTINKDPWGLLERKDKAEAKVDLRSRGLCLVPISCTPQVYRENNGSDYWTPTYRGSLYR